MGDGLWTMPPVIVSSRVPYGVPALVFTSRFACGVDNISSSSMRLALSSSSELVVDVSLVSAVTEPIERGLKKRSWPLYHALLKLPRGESLTPENIEPRLCGISMPPFDTTGDEPGVDWSGIVE